ncbi:MAG: matrixin family metalloprotease [Methanoregulaceae archaeon]|nr:matrixin family metalloprotease [Methanoregulaceae archaeon]
MGFLRILTGWVFGYVLVATAHAGAYLPEMDRFLSYGQRALDAGHMEAARAATDVILLGEVRYALAEGPSEAREVLKAAMREWEVATDGEVRFVEVPANEAQITIGWANELRFRSLEAGGVARWQRAVRRDGDGLRGEVSATIELRLRVPSGRRLNSDQLMQCALHEIGHILGLDDSSARGEAMGPLDLRRPITRLSDGDLSALRELRSRAWNLRDIVTQAEALAMNRP